MKCSKKYINKLIDPQKKHIFVQNRYIFIDFTLNS